MEKKNSHTVFKKMQLVPVGKSSPVLRTPGLVTEAGQLALAPDTQTGPGTDLNEAPATRGSPAALSQAASPRRLMH